MIYFVRHGETDFNLFGVTQGQLNTSLNLTGLKQAKEVSEKLKDLNLDIIFSSPLNRTKQTAEEINKYHQKEIVYDPRLMEISKGKLEGQKNPKEIYEKFFKNPHKYGGEDTLDVYSRIKTFVADLEKHKNKNILIVSHGGVFRYLNFCLMKKDIKKEKPERTFLVPNCEIIEIEF